MSPVEDARRPAAGAATTSTPPSAAGTSERLRPSPATGDASTTEPAEHKGNNRGLVVLIILVLVAFFLQRGFTDDLSAGSCGGKPDRVVDAVTREVGLVRRAGHQRDGNS